MRACVCVCVCVCVHFTTSLGGSGVRGCGAMSPHVSCDCSVTSDDASLTPKEKNDDIIGYYTIFYVYLSTEGKRRGYQLVMHSHNQPHWTSPVSPDSHMIST